MSFLHTFVTLNPNARTDPEAVAADIAAAFPTAPPVTVGRSEESGVVSFDFGAVTVMASVMPMPIPSPDLESCYATSWLWPKAEEELRDHSAHLIVIAQGGDTVPDRIVPLTMAVASILGTCPEASGVYWGHAGQVVKGGVFRDFATRHLNDDRLPVFLWVSCRAGANPDGTTSGYTVGLKQFDLMEFETSDSPLSVGDLRFRLGDLAAYLIRNGPVIKDGNMVGQSAGEKVKVVYADSRFGLEGQVMRLEHERAERPAKRQRKGWE